MLRIKGGTVVTMNAARDVHAPGDVVVADDGSIVGVGHAAKTMTANREIDATGKIVIPGLIQTHVHLCQTLYRNRADDLDLLDWLKKRIWPYEASLDPPALRASARLGIAELLKNGTTALLDMGTVHHYDEVFTAAQDAGIRLVGGKCMMDTGEGVPSRMLETTNSSLDESVALAKRWHGKASGRLRYAFAPRFALSCTEELLHRTAQLSDASGFLVHTHASEQKAECEIVRRTRHHDNIVYLDHLGLRGPRVCLAHCVHPTERELDLMLEAGTRVLHCPSSNLKLASGIAPIPTYMKRGICVSLGADGAPCNNFLDPWEEMRLAALLQKPLHGPTSMPAREVLGLATIEGAKTLGIEKMVGSIEPGKRADLAIVRTNEPSAYPPSPDVYGVLVYGTRASQVDTVLVDGQVVLEGGKLRTLEEAKVLEDAEKQLGRVVAKL